MLSDVYSDVQTILELARRVVHDLHSRENLTTSYGRSQPARAISCRLMYLGIPDLTLS
jgi:hypothetical protein